MEHIGYSVVDLNTNEEILFFGNTPNECASDRNVLMLPNKIQVHCPEVDKEYNNYKYVKRYLENSETTSIEYDGTIVLVKRPF